MDIDLVLPEDKSKFETYLCDSNEKYFWTYPFCNQGIYLKQSSNKDIFYMDETAVRARAGLLNFIAWSALLCGFTIPQYAVIIYIGPFIIYDMMSGVLFGLTPFCPTGVLGTIIAWNFKPFYKPSIPKRFAWVLGGILAVLCVVLRVFVGPHILIRIVVCICIILTSIESSLGFCVGCWCYKIIRKYIFKPNDNQKTNKTTKKNNKEESVSCDCKGNECKKLQQPTDTPPTTESTMQHEDNEQEADHHINDDRAINIDTNICVE